jgi:hypothetical protein
MKIATIFLPFSLAPNPCITMNRLPNAAGARPVVETPPQRKLEKRIDNFNTSGRPLLKTALDIAYEYQTPLGIEYVDKEASTRPMHLDSITKHSGRYSRTWSPRSLTIRFLFTATRSRSIHRELARTLLTSSIGFSRIFLSYQSIQRWQGWSSHVLSHVNSHPAPLVAAVFQGGSGAP